MQRPSIHIPAVGLLLALAAAAPLGAQAPEPERIPVLIVSGANNHDWEWTTPSLARILAESGRFKVSITYAPETDLANAEDLARYKAVVLDYNGPRWGEAAEKAFLDAVSGGLGVAVIHAANNAFPGWVEYETLVGHCWREGTGHGRFHPFDVTVVERDSPITRTMPDLVQHPDELYHRLEHMHEAEFRLLATAFSSEESGGTGAHEPMVTTLQYGAGRVFHTPLGHVWKGSVDSRASHDDPQFRTLVARGVEWAATGEVVDGMRGANQVDVLDRRAGWRPLFDGRSLDGWRGYGQEAPGAGWTVTSGCIRRSGPAGDLITRETFQDFELELEYQLAAGTNSGIKYRVPESGAAAVGPEFQIIDDARHLQLDPRHLSGALYDVLACTGQAPIEPPGRWNTVRIVVRGNTIQHWLNGVLMVDATVGDERFEAFRALSKFKDRADFAAPVAGHILLQDHGGEVWYRNVRVRDLAALEAREIPLLAAEGARGGPLSGWVEVGDARWTRTGNTITGTVGGGRQSFLCTSGEYSDFLLEVDVRVEVAGNSGIQFRSFRAADGAVNGFQAEIDPSPRSWSGGIFFEGGAWLSDLAENPAGRAAFDREGWNRYRIEAVGPRVRVYVNDVLCGHVTNINETPGFIAFQVHSGSQGTFHWRNPRLFDLTR